MPCCHSKGTDAHWFLIQGPHVVEPLRLMEALSHWLVQLQEFHSERRRLAEEERDREEEALGEARLRLTERAKLNQDRLGR